METQASSTEVYIGRQPIYDRTLNVTAYELLYRAGAGATSAAGMRNGDAATAHVFLTTLIDIGIERVAHDRPVVIKLAPSFLELDALTYLPSHQVLVEILPDQAIEDGAMEAVKRLAQSPVRVVLRDPIDNPNLAPIADFADIIKIDVSKVDAERLPARIASLRAYGAELLAEKVETHDEHALCQKLGFDLFQGYFLSEPKMVAGKRLTTERLSVLQLLSSLDDPLSTVDDLETIVSRNVALSYQLLRYVNSAFIGLRSRVDSIRRAIVLLGPPVIRQIASLMLTQETNDKPLEVTRTALVRAKLTEQIGLILGDQRPAYYVTGLFSTLESLLDVPIEDVVSALPLTDEVIGALLNHDGPIGRALGLAKLYERCDWADPAFAGLDQGALNDAYVKAVQFADESIDMMRSAAA